MQAQTNYTTQAAATFWFRRGVRALASLLVVAVLIVGLLYALGFLGQASRSASNGAGATAARPLVTYCRVCQDEVLAAQPPRLAHSEPARTKGSSASPARPLLSQVYRDEALADKQSTLIAPAYGQPSLDTSDPRQRGPR